MSARYESRSQRWSYACWGESSSGEKLCWSVAGLPIDRAVEKSFLETMVPDEIDLSLAVDREVEKQADSLDSAWRARIEQALGLVIEAVALHPIDVPRRTTRIRVQWHGGAVSEIEIGRPSRGQYRARAPEVVPRIRELATAGLDDDEIARRLRDDGLRSGSGLPWSADRVVSARRRHRISRVTDRPRNPPLPERHPDGRYSVPGAAARFGVSHNVVRAWIEASRCAAAWVRS